LTTRCAQLDEANRAWQQFHQNQLEIFREKLKDLISIDPNSSLEQIAEKLLHQSGKIFSLKFFRNISLDSIQKQLRDYQTNESILAQNLQERNQEIDRLNEQQIQSKIELIHQQNQTESSWSIVSHRKSFSKINSFVFLKSNDENPWNADIDNQQLKEYIDEISFLSSNEISDELNKQCEQILSKQNLKLSLYPNLDHNQLALVAIHSLSNQHLIDEAKQLYNETIIRALKQEYELINNEKNDLIEQIESESLQSKENISPRTNDWNHFPLVTETQIDDQGQVNHDAFQIMKNKIDRIVNERPELFPELSIDPIERFDQLVSAIEHQTAQIDVLKKELAVSAFELEDKSAIDK
jgi:hypothetical protein